MSDVDLELLITLDDPEGAPKRILSTIKANGDQRNRKKAEPVTDNQNP